MAILVSSLSHAPRIVQERRPGRVVSLLDPYTPFPSAPGYDAKRHLKLEIHDIAEDRPGLNAPDALAVRAILDFVTAWDRAAPLLVHCYAGISRSTATAFLAACAHNPKTDEEEIAQAIRLASATATPNARIVALADAELGREGRMIAAIAKIGRGFPTWPEIEAAEPFEIKSVFDAA
jgi:predicted protein tyrosine phosphatase